MGKDGSKILMKKKFMDKTESLPKVEFNAEFIISKKYLENGKQTQKAINSSEGTWIIEAYASTSDLDTQNSIITTNALLQGAESLKKYNTLLFNHDTNTPIGKIVLSEVRQDKLFVKCAISKSEPGYWEKIQDGTLSKFSIMGAILDAKEEMIGQQNVLMINSLELYEVSLVSVPANVEAKALNFYIEKAFSRNNLLKKDVTVPATDMPMETPSTENVPSQEDPTELLNTLDASLTIIETLSGALEGEDRDNAIRVLQWLQALETKYDPENTSGQIAYSEDTTKDSTKKSVKMEDLKVKGHTDLSDKDYVSVNKVDPESAELEPIVQKSLDTNIEDPVKDEVDNKVEKEIKQEVPDIKIKKEVVTEEEVSLTKSMVGVVQEIKDLAKSVVVALEEVNKRSEEVKKAKDEVAKSLSELRDVLKNVPVRRSYIAESEEEDVRQVENSSLSKARAKVKDFDKLPPQEQLRAVLAEQAKA